MYIVYWYYQFYIHLQMEQEVYVTPRDELYPVRQQSIGKYPYRLTGAIISRSENGQEALGTGILISRRIVLTAAHIIYSRRDRLQNAVQYTDIKFYKGAHKYGKSNNPHNGEYKRVIETRILSEHKNYGMKDEQAIEYDYGILLLESDSSQSQEEQNEEQSHYKSFRLTPICKCQYCEEKIAMDHDKNVNIFGYPKGQGYDNARPIAGEKERFQFVQYESIRNHRKPEWYVRQGRIHYYVSTLGGQSGAPIFLGNHCIGIHLMGGKSNRLNGPIYNGGRLFTIDLLQQILEWIKELKADNFKLHLRYSCFFINKFIALRLPSHRKPQREEKIKQLSKIDHSFTDIKEMEKCSSKLKQLYLIDNNISQINIEQASNLKNLDLQRNPIKSIDLKSNKNLQRLCLNRNKNGLKSIDVSQNTQLTHLFLEDNQLISIDLSKNTKLIEVDLRKNMLRDIDLRNNVLLESILLNFNKIKNIDLSGNKKLQQFGIVSNCLDSIDLRNNTLLYRIGLQDNSLQNIHFFFNQSQFIKEKLMRFDNQKSQKCSIVIHYKFGGSLAKKNLYQVTKMEFEIKMEYQQKSRTNIHGCQYKTYFIEENS